jgi:hypothetical protein
VSFSRGAHAISLAAVTGPPPRNRSLAKHDPLHGLTPAGAPRAERPFTAEGEFLANRIPHRLLVSPDSWLDSRLKSSVCHPAKCHRLDWRISDTIDAGTQPGSAHNYGLMAEWHSWQIKMSILTTPRKSVIEEGRLRNWIFLAFVALLPLHTVVFHAWISWKPWLVLLLVLAVAQLFEAVHRRRWIWHRASFGLFVFLAAVAVSWPRTHQERFARLWLALLIGGVLMLVVQRELTDRRISRLALRAIYWSSAAMGFTGAILSFVLVGAFGPGPLFEIDNLRGVVRVIKHVYLNDGFVALTNWHHDPGYAALWMNLWLVLALVAISCGLGSKWRAINATVVATLIFSIVMTMSRTGLLCLVVALLCALWFDWRRERDRRSLRAVLAGGIGIAAVLFLLAVSFDRPRLGGDLHLALGFRASQGARLDSRAPTPQEIRAAEERAAVTEHRTATARGTPKPPPVAVATPPHPESRAFVWPAYLRFFRENPIRGAGLGHGWATQPQEPHNLLLQLLGETGLLGTAGFLVLLGLILKGGVSRIGAIALITVFAASMTQTLLFEGAWWFAAALALTPDEMLTNVMSVGGVASRSRSD